MKVIFKNLTDEERDEFIQGFLDADIEELTHMEEYHLSLECPWAYPWDEFLLGAIFKGTTPYEWGGEWYRRNKKKILASMEDC